MDQASYYFDLTKTIEEYSLSHKMHLHVNFVKILSSSSDLNLTEALKQFQGNQEHRDQGRLSPVSTLSSSSGKSKTRKLRMRLGRRFGFSIKRDTASSVPQVFSYIFIEKLNGLDC